jgi:hypothetical protein
MELKKLLAFLLVILLEVVVCICSENREFTSNQQSTQSLHFLFDSPAYFIEKCYRDDPEVDDCLQYSGNKLASYLHEGIPELGLDNVEPVIIDEISIALGEGPDAYRATFSNIETYGVSNISLAKVRSDIDTYQFQLTYEIPRIKVRSNFKSTGVL